jgi:hypothetical protein
MEEGAFVVQFAVIMTISTARRSALNAVVSVVVILVAGCSSLQPRHFDSGRPHFEPEKFFEGATRSWGVIENQSGNPRSRFRADMMGRRDGEFLVITQDFTFEDGHTQRRVWRLKREDEHRYEATANDVVGVANGEAFGNAFRWEYTLALRPGNPLANVRFHLWMYLQDDGESMINRVTITKLGLVIGQTTEYFRRGTGSGASIGPAQ